jgi:hypothetical protein
MAHRRFPTPWTVEDRRSDVGECDEGPSPPQARLTRKHIGHVRPSVASQPKAWPATD